MGMDHRWNQALDAVDLHPPSPTKLKKSRKLSTRMTLGFEERLEYSTATCRSREEMLDDFTATCRSLEERMKLSTRWGKDCREQMKFETIKTPAMDPGNEGVISDFLTFVNGKKFYRRKGKTWKRGYLLYEPPGSDGASLIAAMADFLEFNLYNLNLASFSSFSELKNTLRVGTWRSSVIAIHDLDYFDHSAGMLPDLNNELTGSCLLEFVNGLLSSCGNEQIIVFTTNNIDRHDAARWRSLNENIYVHKSSPQPVTLADEGEIVQLDSSRQKPLVDFEATNIKAYQGSLLVSNSEEKNTREASTRRCMTESVCSFVDSMTSISSTDFDALDNRAHLGRAYQSGPIVFNSEKKDTREGLSGECLTKSALSFDDSTKRKSLPFDVNLSSFSEHASQDFDDFDFVGFDYGAGMLPNLMDELKGSCLLDSVHGLVSSCGDEQIIVFATDNRDLHDAALQHPFNEYVYIHKSPPRPDEGETVKEGENVDEGEIVKEGENADEGEIVKEGENVDGGEIVQFDIIKQKPLVNVDLNFPPVEEKIRNPEIKKKGDCNQSPSASASSTVTHVKLSSWKGFEELGMDPENTGIISNLKKFKVGKELFKLFGKSLTRFYLLYGPPGADRSSLIAAMADFLEYRIHNLDVTSFSSLSELRNMLASITNRSLIWIQDSDQCAGTLPDLNTKELTGSCLLKFVDGLLLSCGDERIIVFTTNNRDLHDAALCRPFNKDIYIHKSSPQPVALPAEGEIVQLNSFKQKPLVDFDATNSRTHQSSVFVSNPEKKNTREISKRQSMTESVRSLIDSTTRSSSMDFDAPDNKAHLLRAHQSNPIVFNSENKYTIEGLRGECLTKNVPSLDDSRKQESLLDFDATENKAHLFRAYQIDPVVSLSENKNRGEALKSNIKSVLGLEDLQQHCGDRHDDAAKTSGAIYELAWKSFEVLETLPTEEQPIDCVPLLAQGRLPLEGCVQQEKSPDLPRVMQINGVEQRVTKMPRYLGGLTAQSASSSRWHISLPVLLDPLDQSTKNIEHVARADQCSPTVFLAEKKMVRKCRTMSVIFEENHLHFGRKCECAAKSLGAMRICRKHGINQVCTLKRIHKQHGIHQWPFRQKWATRKGYSLGEENPFEVRRLSMDEKLDSRLQLIHMSQFARSSPRALALSDGGIVRPTALSSSEFAATNNRADLVSQDQSSSAASHYRCKNTRETSDKQGLEDLQQHFGCKHKYALKSLGVSGSMFKSTCRQHWFYWWQCRLKNNEQQAFDATSNRAHLVKVDERGPTVSNALFLDDLRHQFGARCKDAAKGLHAKCIRRQLVIHRLSTAKHTHKQHGIHQWPFQQSAIGLPDGGHILSLSEKKIVSKTLKRKCRSMSVLSLVDCQQHVDRRWEDATKNIGAKRICRQLVIHRVSIAKRICRQHGIHHRWPFERDWATMKGYSLGDERPVEVIRLYTDGKLISRRRRIYISWLGRFSPWRSALPGGLIVGPIALSSSEFAGTNNIAQRVGQDQRGSGSENERTREQEDPREINTNINSNDLRRHSGRITSDDLRRLLGRMNRAEAANYFGVSVATFKRECRKHGIEKWPLKNGAERKKKRRKKDEWRLPDQHGGNNPSSTCRTMATNGLTEIMVGQDLNEFFRTFVDGPTEEMPIDSGSLDDFTNWLSSLDAPPQGSDQPQIMSRLPENDQSTPQCGLPIVVSNEGVASNPDGGPVNPVERERTPEAHNDPIVPASGSHLVASTRSVNIADTTNQSFSQTDSDLARLAAEIEAVSESLKSQTGSPESSLPSSFLQYGEEVQAQVDLFFDLLKLPFEELVMNKSKELTDCMSILVQKRVFPLKEHIVLEIFFNNSSDTFSLFKYHNEEMRQKKELLNSFSSISTKVSNMQSEVLSVKSQLSALDQEENSLLLRLEQILAEKNALLQKKDGCSRDFEKLKEEVKGVSAQTTAARADLLRNDIKRTEMIKRWENLLTFFANPTS